MQFLAGVIVADSAVVTVGDFVIMAKAQNAPLGVLLLLFSVRLWWWTDGGTPRRLAILSSVLIAIATLVNIMTIPTGVRLADAYNQMFLAILPESKNPSADLKAWGLDAKLLKYSGIGAWSPGSGFSDMVGSGLIANKINHAEIARFYLQHPSRIWRHARILLPIALSLRPDWCGNFERAAGRPPGARSTAFTLWSGFHEQVLRRVGRFILILLFISPAIAAIAWMCFPERRREIELLALLSGLLNGISDCGAGGRLGQRQTSFPFQLDAGRMLDPGRWICHFPSLNT